MLKQRKLKNAISKTLSTSTSLSLSALYFNLFGKMANMYTKMFDSQQKIDFDKIDEDFLKKLLPFEPWYMWFSKSTSEKKTSAIDDLDDDGFLRYARNASISYYVVGDEIVVALDEDGISFYTSKDFHIDIDEISKKLPRKTDEAEVARVELVCNDGRDYYTQKSAIQKTTVDINECYNDDFIEVDKRIKEFLLSRDAGLILLHGEAGTGNYILFVL